MEFTPEERKELTAIKGIGDTFVNRLEQMGLGSVEQLAQSSWQYIVEQGAEITGSSCYKNSPQARRAAEEAIYWAGEKLSERKRKKI